MFFWLKKMFAWLTGGELPAADAEEGQRQSCGPQHAPQLTPEQDFEIASAEVEAGNPWWKLSGQVLSNDPANRT